MLVFLVLPQGRYSQVPHTVLHLYDVCSRGVPRVLWSQTKMSLVVTCVARVDSGVEGGLACFSVYFTHVVASVKLHSNVTSPSLGSV